jgi:adenylate cyclase
MRAGRWFTGRDIAAARSNWERARRIADQLADDAPDRMTMRIAPRTKLCGNSWRGVPTSVEADFEELRALCETAGDKVSLAIGMTGLTTEHLLHGRVRDASRTASEQIGLLEAIGDPKLAFAVGFAAFAKYQSGQGGEVLRCANSIVETIERDPAKKKDPGSPLPVALGLRGFARWSLGHPGWKPDLDNAVAIARNRSQGTYASGVAWKYGPAIANGVLLADDHAVRELDEALIIAEGLGDGYTLGLVRYVLAGALVNRGDPADCRRALELIDQLRDMVLHRQYLSSETPILDIYAARLRARRGDIDGAIPEVRTALDVLYSRGQTGWCVSATGVLVDMLLNRGGEADTQEAEETAERLAHVQMDQNLAASDLELLRMRALLAQARRQMTRYRDLVDRYRTMAKSLGFEGHMAIAEAMSSRRVH